MTSITSDAIQLLRDRIVPLFHEDYAELERAAGICPLTNEYSDNGYLVTDSYKTKTVQSDIARLFTLGSYDRIGLFQGTWEKPGTAMRLMDYKGATLVIPVDSNEQPEFWCSGKYVPKVGPKSPFLIKPISGSASYAVLLDDHRPSLVISITPRKELWFKNMIIGDANTLVYCDENGATFIPRANWKAFKSEFLKLNKKAAAEALVVLRGINLGYIAPTSERAQKLYESNLEFTVSCQNLLPLQPQARSFWLSALGTVK